MSDSAHRAAFDSVRDFLGRIFTTSEAGSLESVAELELSLTQARLLFTLAHHQRPVAIGDLGDEVGLSAASAGRNVDHLVRGGLIERAENPQDRRVKLVAVTTAGRDLAAAHLKTKEDAVRRVLGDLDTEQCLALIEALAPLTKDHPHDH